MKLNKYKYYTIPKGTELFRKADSINTFDNMFFSFTPEDAHCNNCESNIIQIWRTICEVDGFLMIRCRKNYKVISAIVDIYNYYFPKESLGENDDIYIKQNLETRMKLINLLRSNNITNWISSIENKSPMEFFLFDSVEKNSKIIEYIKSVNYSSYNFEYTKEFDNSIFQNCP